MLPQQCETFHREENDLILFAIFFNVAYFNVFYLLVSDKYSYKTYGYVIILIDSK